MGLRYCKTLTAYFDNFNVEVKESKNIKPTDFSILHPVTGDAFNLDTITNFQTIPFSWEESIDLDTVLYTNKLICNVVCDGHSYQMGLSLLPLMSNGTLFLSKRFP